MAKGSEAAFHTLLIIVIVVLTLVLIFFSIKQPREREKGLNEERYSLVNTLNSYELFKKSLEAAWRISAAQAIFRASNGLDLEGGYWYSYNPSSGRSMAIPQSGCSDSNPKICLPSMQDVSSVMANYMQDYTSGIEGRTIPLNLVAMRVDGIKTLIWPSSGSVTSKISHLTSADFASGRTKIGRQEEINTSFDSDFRKMIFSGYMTVQAAAELSDEVINQGKLRYNPIVPVPASPETSTLGSEDFRKKAGDYIAAKLKVAEDFYGKTADGARILHVRIDPDDHTEAWAFHLTDDKNHFTSRPDKVDNMIRLDDYDHPNPGKECIVFSENEEGSRSDEAMVWYISPGGKVSKTGKLCDGIYNDLGCNADKNYIAAANCKKNGVDAECSSGSGDFCIGNPPSPPMDNDAKCSDSLTDKAGPYPGTESAGGEPYTTAIKDQWCTDGECDLLEKDGSGKYYYMPKYELLCDSSGYWRVCNEAAQDAMLQAGEKTYRCNNKAWKAGAEAANVELIVSTGVNYYPSTLGVLPEQGGLVMKYDASSAFTEEPKYYKDTGSGFSKEPISLTVKAKDYLPVLDCNKYPDGTRFALDPDDSPVEYNIDLMCYQDASRGDTYSELYTCDRGFNGLAESSNTIYRSDNPSLGLARSEIGISPNRYQCIGSGYIYHSHVFCKEHATSSEGDSVNPDPKYAHCCINWNYNDAYTAAGNTYNFETDSTLPRIEVSWRGNEKTDFNPGGSDNTCSGNTFCSGDKVVNAAKGEMCDTRNFACSTFSQADATANGCAYYCDPKGHKFQCSPYNSCKDKPTPDEDFAEAYPSAGCDERFCGPGKPTYNPEPGTIFADSTNDVTATTCYNPDECRTEKICSDEDGLYHSRGEIWTTKSTCIQYKCPTLVEEGDGGLCTTDKIEVKPCNDGKECTADSCDGGGGCSYLPLTGTSCTAVPNGVCVNGVCSAPTPTPTPTTPPTPTPTMPPPRL